MSEETIRLAIGLIVLGAALIAVGIGVIMADTAAAQSAAGGSRNG